MKTYNDYLQGQGYAQSTIATNQRELKRFKKWCASNHTTVETIDYKSCLTYIKHLRDKGNSPKTINHKLSSLKSYFTYMVSVALRSDNPIESTTIKGVKRSMNYTLLEAEELEDLYYSYPTETIKTHYWQLTAKRAKVITGLMIYQGLNTTDLKHLKTEHLKLSKGKIYVPGTKRSNARDLELKPWQIMEFIEYVNEVRPIIQDKIQNHSPELFPSNARFNSIIHHITKKLRKYNQKVQDIKQIRASVITHWLKQYNLRKVQYMAGHRYISSTEKYLQDDLENLHEMVNTYHPIS